MEININQKQIHEVVSAAILQSIDREGRDALIQSAIGELLKPVVTKSGLSQTTAINDIFTTAVEKEAGVIAERMISESEDFKKKVRDLVSDAMLRLFSDEHKNEMSEILSQAFARCIEEKSYDNWSSLFMRILCLA